MAFSCDNKAWKSFYDREESQIKQSPRSQSASTARIDPLFTDFSQEENCIFSQPPLSELRDMCVFSTDGDDVKYSKVEEDIKTESVIENTEDLKCIKPEFTEYVVNSVGEVIPSQDEIQDNIKLNNVNNAVTESRLVNTTEMVPTLSCSNVSYWQEKSFSCTGKYGYNNCEKLLDETGELHSYHCSENIQNLDERLSSPKVEINRQLAHRRNDKNKISCSYCSRKFSNFNFLNDHLKQHTNEQDSDSCQTASSTVAGETDRTKFPDKPGSRKHYDCWLCGKSYHLKESLIYHIRSHTGEKPFTCHICSKTFHRRFLLQSHLRIHFKKKSFSCPKCNIKFSLKIAFNSHVKKVHKSVLRNVLCEKCDITFPSKQALQIHLGKKRCKGSTTGNLQSVLQDTFSPKLQEAVPRVSISDLTKNVQGSSKRMPNVEATITENEVVTTSKMTAAIFRSDSFREQEKLFTCTAKYACSDCEKVFSKKIKLHYHYLSEDIHHLSDCSFCKRALSPKIKINTNFSLRENEGIIFACIDCPKRFTNEYYFKDHLIHCKAEASNLNEIISSNDVEDKLETTASCDRRGSRKHYSCYQCGRSFLSKDYLKIHIRTHTGQRPFQCNICPKSFHRNYILRSHLKIHSKKIFFPCTKCNLQFSLQIGLKNHIKRAHHIVLEDFRCAECNMTFCSKQDLEKHFELKRTSDSRYQITISSAEGAKATGNLESTVKDWPYLCGICGKTFCKEDSFQSHLRCHTKRMNWRCGDCRKLFFSKNGLEYHKKLHGNEPLFYCKYCQKGFIIKALLITHMRTHTKDKPKKCRICGKGFAQTSDRNIHERRHTGIRPYNCKQCKRNFFTKSGLENHSVIHFSQPPMFPCDQCTKILKTEYYLKSHVKAVHTKKEGTHKCLVCCKTFSKNSKLQSHMKSHSNNRPSLKCNHCEKSFLEKMGLKYHMLSHTGVKEFCCDICGSKFARKYSLKCHILNHLGETFFTCKICDKEFVLKNSLISHMTTHTVEKLYKCAECGQSFSSKIILKSHLMTHMKVTPFFCELCDRSFSRKTVLKYHMWIKHELLTE